MLPDPSPGGQACESVDPNIIACQTEGDCILHEVIAEDPADPLFLLLTRRTSRTRRSSVTNEKPTDG